MSSLSETRLQAMGSLSNVLARPESAKSDKSGVSLGSSKRDLSRPSTASRGRHYESGVGARKKTNVFSTEHGQEVVTRVLGKLPRERTDDDINEMVELVSGVKFFQALEDDEVVRELLRYMTRLDVAQGQDLFKQGDVGTAFYIILTGSVAVNVRDKKTASSFTAATLFAGDSFGELALTKQAPRSATINCIDPCSFAVLESEVYKRILQTVHDKEMESRASFLSTIPLFHTWAHDLLLDLASILTVHAFEPNKVVVQQGQDADRVYFVRAGSLIVMKQIEFPSKDAHIVNDLTHGQTEWLYLDPEATDRKNFQLLVEDAAGFEMVDTGMQRAMKHAKLLEVGEIGPREFFGEIALLKQTNRAASVISKTEVDLLGLAKNDFVRRIVGKTHDAMLDSLDRYPSDEQIRAAYIDNLMWSVYRSQLVEDIVDNHKQRVEASRMM